MADETTWGEWRREGDWVVRGQWSGPGSVQVMTAAYANRLEAYRALADEMVEWLAYEVGISDKAPTDTPLVDVGKLLARYDALNGQEG